MRILVIGDSIVKHLGLFLTEGLHEHDVTLKSFPGYTIEKVKDAVSTLDNRYDWVFVHVGTNNTSRDHPETMCKKFGSLFEEILLFNPNVKVIVSGILPRKENQFPEEVSTKAWFAHQLPSLNERIQHVNSKLERLCLGREAFFYYRLLEPVIGRDGLHLGRHGHAQMGKNIVKTLRTLIDAYIIRTPAATNQGTFIDILDHHV